MKKYCEDYKLLLRSIPGIITAIYCVAVVVMNLMANKIIFNSHLVAADGGLLVSWIPFLCMDMVVKRYGPRAANKLNLFALFVNLAVVAIFAVISAIQIDVGAEYAQGDIYESFNSVFSCTWFVLFGSSVAFIAAGMINNFSNWGIGKLFKKNPDGKLAYVTRSYISTFIGQFADNLIFATIVFIIFAPIYWGYSLTLLQCIGSATVGAVLELIMEVIFSPIGYSVTKKWKKEKVGAEYISLYAPEMA